MSRNLVRPFFPIPPKEYDQDYFEEIIRSFSVYLDQIQNPGQGRNTSLVLTDLQTDSLGLEPGSLYEGADSEGLMGYVKIAKEDAISLRGVSASALVGAVTVTT
tara:strand:- start:45 stop:356 length:312 start_codon:yes stop_codon:yes gene_type:complete